MGCCTVVRLLERALAVLAEVCQLGWAGLGGAGMGKLQDCQGVWTVWGCSSEMVGDCFPSRIPTMSRKGAYVLQRVG